MSRQPMSPELVERLFARFVSIYGAPKMASMWPADQVDHAELKRVWGEQLGRYPLKVVGRAVQALIDQPGEWPPSLSHFVSLCREYNRAEAKSPTEALPAPGSAYTSHEQAKANIERIKAMVRAAMKVQQP